MPRNRCTLWRMLSGCAEAVKDAVEEVEEEKDGGKIVWTSSPPTAGLGNAAAGGGRLRHPRTGNDELLRKFLSDASFRVVRGGDCDDVGNGVGGERVDGGDGGRKGRRLVVALVVDDCGSCGDIDAAKVDAAKVVKINKNPDEPDGVLHNNIAAPPSISMEASSINCSERKTLVANAAGVINQPTYAIGTDSGSTNTVVARPAEMVLLPAVTAAAVTGGRSATPAAKCIANSEQNRLNPGRQKPNMASQSGQVEDLGGVAHNPRRRGLRLLRGVGRRQKQIQQLQQLQHRLQQQLQQQFWAQQNSSGCGVGPFDNSNQNCCHCCSQPMQLLHAPIMCRLPNELPPWHTGIHPRGCPNAGVSHGRQCSCSNCQQLMTCSQCARCSKCSGCSINSIGQCVKQRKQCQARKKGTRCSKRSAGGDTSRVTDSHPTQNARVIESTAVPRPKLDCKTI